MKDHPEIPVLPADAKPRPKVSIGMPVYNGERYIRQALDALLKQSIRDFELIISDNSSVDRTEQICLQYGKFDSRIKFYRQEKNIGAMNNFQFVLNKARGKYFMWAACDDYWDENWLEVLLNNFKDGTVLSFGHVITVDQSGSLIRRHRFRQFHKNRYIRLLQLFMSEENGFKANYIYGLFLRECLIKFKLRDCYGSDVLFIFELVQFGDLATSENSTLYKRELATSEGNTAKEAYAGKCRKLLMIDYFPYYRMYLQIANGLFLKTLLSLLLPFKYGKSLGILFGRIVLAKLTRFI